MKKNINWGIFPEEPIKIQSLVEVTIYILIFILCFYLYNKWYDVPQRNVFVKVENLGIKDSSTITNKYCNLYYTLPMTKDQSIIDDRIKKYGKEAMSTIRANFYYYEPHHLHKFLRPTHAIYDSIRTDYRLLNDDFEFKTEESTYHFYARLDSTKAYAIEHYSFLLRELVNKEVDSLINVFNEKVSIPKGYSMHYVYSELKYDGLNVKDAYETSDTMFKRSGKINGNLFSEYFGASNTNFFYYNLSLFPEDNIFGYIKSHNPFYARTPSEIPSFFAREDISQAYINLRVESITIDSINLKLNFIGATEFSRMTPEPDEIGLSYIEFRDPKKIAQIRLNGLTFLAKFKDLEGIQQIRLFTVTAIMSGLFTIFIVFIILYVYKIKRSMSNKSSDDSDSKKNSNEENVETIEVVNKNIEEGDNKSIETKNEDKVDQNEIDNSSQDHSE